ncbi:MAG TPA: TrkA family potassium uptake protein [Dehalococcoidia bacterium]|jgi:trk system potassium uptake protein TrkA|nr:TrkA family potassium uptake protein [Dehalococcoidia bacterium]
MYIIVVGAGQVGYYLCKALLDEGHEVLVLDKNPGRCERINEELGSVCTWGDGCETAVLAEAGAGRADMLIAVTDEDEDNLVACQVAKHKFHVPRTIARINNPKNETLFKKLGIDCTVSSTNLILEHVEHEVPTHPLMHLLKLGETGTEIVQVRVPAGSGAVGRRLQEVNLPPGSIVALVIRRDQNPVVATPDTILEAEDQVIAATRPESETALREALSGV